MMRIWPTPAAAKIENERRAEPAGADHQHARGLQLLLALAADLLQHQLALVALDFVMGEHGGNVCHLLHFVIAGLDPAIHSIGACGLLRRNGVDARIRSSGMTLQEEGHPVEPKPPGPRSVSASASTATISTEATGAITNWAMRSPRWTKRARCHD